MDDVLIFGKDTEEHDERLEKVLQQIQAEGASYTLTEVSISQIII